MGRQHDILFCKIAISNGLVSKENAQKCLNICERKERDGGRRPNVGAVFSKLALMRPDDVQRVAAAVKKRTDSGSPTVRAVAAEASDQPRAAAASGARGRRPGSRRGSRRGHWRHGRDAPDSRPPARRIDQKTLVTGLGAGFVFVAVLGTIFWLYLARSEPPDSAASSRGDAKGTVAAAPKGAESPRGGESKPEKTSKADKKPTAKKTPERASKTTPKKGADRPESAFQTKHRRALSNARLVAFADNRPDLAIEGLRAFSTKNRGDYDRSAELLEELESLISEFEKLSTEGEEEEIE